MTRSANSKHSFVLFVLLFLLIGAPLLSWLLAFCTHIPLFVIPILFWINIPASLFGRPLFKPTMIGYDPVGIAGWSVIVLFYVLIAVVLWAVIHVCLRLRTRKRA